METSETFKKKKEKNKIFDTGMPLQCKIGHNTGKLRALSKSDCRQGLKRSEVFGSHSSGRDSSCSNP